MRRVVNIYSEKLNALYAILSFYPIFAAFYQITTFHKPKNTFYTEGVSLKINELSCLKRTNSVNAMHTTQCLLYVIFYKLSN